MTSTMRALVVLFALLLFCRSARADEARAAELFEKGRALARDGHCGEAIPVLLDSVKAAEGVGALLNLGLCYEQTGRMVEGHRYFVRAEQLAVSRADPRSAEAHDRATALATRLSRVTVRVAGNAEPDLSLRLDGEPLAREHWNVAEYVGPGSHSVVASSSRRSPTTLTVVARAGESVELVVPVVATSPSTSTASANGGSTEPVSDQDRPPRTQRTLGWILGGVGTAAITLGGVFGVLSMVDHGSLVDRCATYPTCDASMRGELDDLNGDARMKGNVATGAIIAGTVLLVSGVILVLTAPGGR